MSANAGAHGARGAHGAGGGRKRRSGPHEEHENHERWLVTYADMLTLLMVLFVVLFAISQVDQKKFDELKNGLADSFGQARVVSGTDTVVGSDGGRSILEFPPRQQVGPVVPPKSQVENVTQERAQAAAEVKKFEDVRQRIEQALAKEGLRDSVLFRYDQRGLVVSVITDKVLFPADYATLQPIGVKLLDAIGPVLATLTNSIEVEGHTNQAKVKPRFYPTEWELSSARAVTVVRYLIDHERVAARRLTAAGFADQHPLLPPSDPRANRLNRRVEIVVGSTLPPSAAALIPSVAPQQSLPTS